MRKFTVVIQSEKGIEGRFDRKVKMFGKIYHKFKIFVEETLPVCEFEPTSLHSAQSSSLL